MDPWNVEMSKHSIQRGSRWSERARVSAASASERFTPSSRQPRKDWTAFRLATSSRSALAPRCGTRSRTLRPRRSESTSASASAFDGLDGEQHLVGRLDPLVVEGEEGREQLVARELLPGEGVGPRVEELAAAHGEDLDDQVGPLAVDAHHVPVGPVVHEDPLGLQAALHGAELVAHPGRVLEAHGRGRLAHARLEPLGRAPLPSPPGRPPRRPRCAAYSACGKS